MVRAPSLVDKMSVTLIVSYNSDDFFTRAPASVGPATLVALLSGTGRTKETIRAAEWAIGRGATVAAVTLKEEGDLAKAVPTAFVARTGHGSQIVLQLVALALLKREGFDTAARHRALAALPTALLPALGGFQPRTHALPAAIKDVPVTQVFA